MLSTPGGRCHEKIGVGNSLFRRKVPCSGRGNCLFGAEQGIVRSALELQYKWTPESAQSAEMAGDFQHFPAIFPALRESRGSPRVEITPPRPRQRRVDHLRLPSPRPDGE